MPRIDSVHEWCYPRRYTMTINGDTEMSSMYTIIRYLKESFFRSKPSDAHPKVSTAPSGTQSVHVADLLMSQRVIRDMERLDTLMRPRPVKPVSKVDMF